MSDLDKGARRLCGWVGAERVLLHLFSFGERWEVGMEGLWDSGWSEWHLESLGHSL